MAMGELEKDNYEKLEQLIDAGNRAFGALQVWNTGSADSSGVGGERLLADILALQVDALAGGPMLFVGLDLGKPGAPSHLIDFDPRQPVRGFGVDIDLALFLREHQGGSQRYGDHDRALIQDHLVLVDSKQWADGWDQTEAFQRARDVLVWMRETLGHPRMLGSGNNIGSLRMSYHFAFTGPWAPNAWFSDVTQAGKSRVVSPGFNWWNEEEDFVFAGPAEVLIGQLCVLLRHAHPHVRDVVPSCLLSMLPPEGKGAYLA